MILLRIATHVLWRERAAVTGGGMPLGQPVAVAEELVPECAVGIFLLHQAPAAQDWRDVVDELLVGHWPPGVHPVDAVDPGVPPAGQLIGDLGGAPASVRSM
jgi:hypothetical protein